MDDLISRAALLKECAECQKTDPRFEERGWASHFLNDAGQPSTEWYCVEDMIENAPSVDAAPVKCGQWTERHVDYASDCAIDEVQTAKCSVCGLYHTTPYLYSFTDFKFCPNCGAKMDKED